MPNTRLILLLFSLIAVILLFLFSSSVFPWTTDSMFYISTAESLRQFKGLFFSNFFVAPATPDFLPTVFEPPGYPILIAKLSFWGLDPYIASLIWPYLGFILLPTLFFLLFKKFMPVTGALAASFIASFMLPILKCSLMAWADIPYLCFSLIAIIMALVILEKQGRAHLFFVLLAGMLAGYAFLIRYVGATLLLSIGIGFLIGWVLKVFSFKDFIKTSLIYALGVFALVFPYLWRNLSVFGKLQPMQMPASQLSLMNNIEAYLRSLGEMFLPGFPYAGMVILVLIMGLTVIFIFSANRLIDQNKGLFIAALILCAYFWLNTLLLLGFKTVYFAPEDINERYLIQLAWIVVAAMALLCYQLFKNLDRPKQIGMLGFVLSLFIIMQFWASREFVSYQKTIKDLATKIEAYSPLLKDVPSDYIIVSNVAEITYYYAKRNVRMLSNYTPYGLWKMLNGKRKYVVFLIKQKKFQSPAWEYPSLWNNPEGYKKIFSDNNVDVLILK